MPSPTTNSLAALCTDEARGFLSTSYFHAENNNAKKAAMLIVLALFLAMSIGIVFFHLTLDARGDALWTFLLATFGYLLGRNHEGEVRHQRAKRKRREGEQPK